MLATTDSVEIAQCLESFSERLNAHPRMRTLLKCWEPYVVVSSTDTGCSYTLVFKDTRVAEVRKGTDESRDHLVRVCAAEDLLKRIFSGADNPATAFLDGRLQVYAADKDQIKLDAIALVLWGI